MIISKGIVLTVDNRLLYYTPNESYKIQSENITKIFQLNPKIGAITAERGFLSKNTIYKEISYFFEEFQIEIMDIQDLNVKNATEKLHSFFEKKYNWRERLKKNFKILRNYYQKQGCRILDSTLDNYPGRFKYKDLQGNIRDGKVEVDEIKFLVAGYNEKWSPEVYSCSIPGKIQRKQIHGKYGVTLIGQSEIAQRILLGFDEGIFKLQFMKKLLQNHDLETIKTQLYGLQYDFPYETMTIQDAIDFCTSMIMITSSIMRFMFGLANDSNTINMAVITSDKGFQWIKRPLSYF